MGMGELKTLNVIRFAKTLGKRHVQQGTLWLPSAAIYGTSLAILLVYFSDWKAVGKWIPYYGSRRQLRD